MTTESKWPGGNPFPLFTGHNNPILPSGLIIVTCYLNTNTQYKASTAIYPNATIDHRKPESQSIFINA